jgi:hypothetical protein
MVIENMSYNNTKYLGYFLSHITVSICPQLEAHQVHFMKFELGSPNEHYNIFSCTMTGMNMGVNFTAFTHGGRFGANVSQW